MSTRNECLSMEPMELLKECDQEFRKSRGHGGQKVNKTSVAVRVTHRASGLTATEDSSRSQVENRIHALRKLQWMMVCELREGFCCPEGFTVEPPPSMQNPKRLLWTAVLLDAWAECSWDPKGSAEKLGLSVSKLIRIVYKDPDLWQVINCSRLKLGLHSLKGS